MVWVIEWKGRHDERDRYTGFWAKNITNTDYTAFYFEAMVVVLHRRENLLPLGEV
jgi:hypothetical protein